MSGRGRRRFLRWPALALGSGSLVVVLAGLLAVLVSGAATASTHGTHDARLVGQFTMQGRINVASHVYGEHPGQKVTRTWTFIPQCGHGVCKTVVLKRLRSSRGVLNKLTLTRQSAGVYSGKDSFHLALDCNGARIKSGGVANETITVRIVRTVSIGGTRYATGLTASYVNPSRYQYTKCPGDIGHDGAVYTGARTVRAIASTPSTGYFILTADGGAFNFGAATSHGSDIGKLPFGQHAVGLAVDASTGGYWILRSNGAVNAFGAPAKGSLAGKLHNTYPTAIAADGSSGYLVLTADGGVHAFGNATWKGSAKGKLGKGVRAVSIAVAPSGGYWVLTSNGSVRGFGISARGSLKGKLKGKHPVDIVADPLGGYLILTGNGGVHPFGKAKWYGSSSGKLPHGVGAVSLAVDSSTGGYWLLKSDDGVDHFHAPWKGSLR